MINSYGMQLVFSNDYHPDYDGYEARFQKIGEVAFRRCGVAIDYEVDVLFVGDEEIHAINRDYRGVDRVTDVISFAFNDDKDPSHQILGDEVERILGEILICIPQALRQAKEIGNSEEREICFLFCHGLLHLLGYDHMKEEDEKVMFALQDAIMEEVSHGK